MALSNRKNKNRNKNGRVDRVGVKGIYQDGRSANVDRVRKEDLQEDVSTIVKVWNQIAIIIFSLLFQFFQLVLVTFFKPVSYVACLRVYDCVGLTWWVLCSGLRLRGVNQRSRTAGLRLLVRKFVALR